MEKALIPFHESTTWRLWVMKTQSHIWEDNSFLVLFLFFTFSFGFKFLFFFCYIHLFLVFEFTCVLSFVVFNCFFICRHNQIDTHLRDKTLQCIINGQGHW